MANSHKNSKCGWKYKWTDYEDNIMKEYYPRNGWKKIKEVLPHRDKDGIQCRAKKLNIKYLEYNENYFEEIDSNQKAYWLGFLFADGYVSTDYRWGLELQIADKNHLHQLLVDLDSNHNIRERERKSGYSKNKKSCYIIIKNKKMYLDLVKHGILPQKTNYIQFPQFTESYLWSFVCGFFDGDGTYYIGKELSKKGIPYQKSISCVCKCKSFLLDLQKFLEKSGIKSGIRKKRENLYSLHIESKDGVSLFIKKAFANEIHTLERKSKKAKQILKYCLV